MPFRPEAPPLVNKETQDKFMESLVGPNLIRGDYNPLRGFVGMTKDYNTALTGYDEQGQPVPNISRALTFALEAGGGAPVGALASGGSKKIAKSIAEGLMRLTDDDIAAKTGNATAALRKAATTAPEAVPGFMQVVRPKDVLSQIRGQAAFVIDDAGRVIQIEKHLPEHANMAKITASGSRTAFTLPPNPPSAMIRAIRQMNPRLYSDTGGSVYIVDNLGKEIRIEDLPKLGK